jgi:hypothetical protein
MDSELTGPRMFRSPMMNAPASAPYDILPYSRKHFLLLDEFLVEVVVIPVGVVGVLYSLKGIPVKLGLCVMRIWNGLRKAGYRHRKQ